MNIFFKEQMLDTEQYGRIIMDHGHIYHIHTEKGVVPGQVSGKLRYQEDTMPVVGDYVRYTYTNGDKEAIIHEILKRQSAFKRKIAGNTFEEQVQGANFDYVFVIMSLNKDFNLRKLERFVLAAWDTGATPVVVLTKKDLCEDVESKIVKAKAVAPSVDIIAISSLYNEGLQALERYMIEGKTIALFGASGVGKSTLINTLSKKEVMRVNKVREDDDRGRHTTTHRQLIIADNQVAFMDTPGMRELGVWDEGAGTEHTFSDVISLTKQCRFNNCTHHNEPGCKIREAILEGKMEQERYDSYLKLKKEAAFIQKKAATKKKNESKSKAKYSRKRIKNYF